MNISNRREAPKCPGAYRKLIRFYQMNLHAMALLGMPTSLLFEKAYLYFYYLEFDSIRMPSLN